MAADYDHIIIDGAPRNYEVARSAILAADMLLIPVQPSGADFWASRETVRLVHEAHSFKETQKAAFVVSRKIGRTSLGRDIAEALAEFKTPHPHSRNYATCGLCGISNRWPHRH